MSLEKSGKCPFLASVKVGLGDLITDMFLEVKLNKCIQIVKCDV